MSFHKEQREFRKKMEEYEKERGYFHPTDLNFMRTHKIGTEDLRNNLQQNMNSSEPNTCLQQRRVQEVLRDEYNHMSDQQTWNANNKVIHTYRPSGLP